MTLISNAYGAFRKVTSFLNGKDDGGEPFFQPTAITQYRASAAVSAGDVLEFVIATASVPLSVQKMVTTTSQLKFAGVALNNAAAGENVLVAQHGYVMVNFGATTTSFNYLLKPATTNGVGTEGSAAPDATTVAGTILGIIVGTGDGTYSPVHLTRL